MIDLVHISIPHADTRCKKYDKMIFNSSSGGSIALFIHGRLIRIIIYKKYLHYSKLNYIAIIDIILKYITRNAKAHLPFFTFVFLCNSLAKSVRFSIVMTA